ncbi:hypothetical protein [Streptomyces anandii]|uniref:hypothetical protein n=1 Tax=Streptomyces anandii TaxID=285454 RepID=UPI0016719F05|nr:hypothetical protein [Streptomyces anandii]GGY07885.1 hypothetical protein GCM10010510_62190 [Streptomyces anandii JCM 4720]
MARTRTQRLSLLTASTALAAGGVLLPTSAFAADAHTAAPALAAAHGGHGHGHWDHSRHNGSSGASNRPGGQPAVGNIIIVNNIPITNSNTTATGAAAPAAK